MSKGRYLVSRMLFSNLTQILVSLVLCFTSVWSLADTEPVCRSNHDTESAQNRYKTTILLDALLDGYDKRFHPGFYSADGKRMPTVVDVNLNIRSMGPVSETDMAYQMDCYFRQQWTDERLKFTGNDTLRVSVNILERMWKPDTHFVNGQKSYLHVVTTPNKLLRIEPTGTVLYSMRITIKASCPMYLENFPMDIQTCPLIVGSHGYGVDDVQYRWSHGHNHSIKMASDMTLSQFDLIGYPQGSENKTLPMGGTSSLLWANFILRRHMGYFLINVYIPSSLLVVISWVGFWINREAFADRIGLGIMTVLTMAFVGIDNRSDLPKVSYSTALDYFVAVSFAAVLATIIEFAGVHFFTKHGSGENFLLDSDEDDDDIEYTDEADANDFDDEKRGVSMAMSASVARHSPSSSLYHEGKSQTSARHVNGNVMRLYSQVSYNGRDVSPLMKDNCCTKLYHCLTGSSKYRDLKLRTSRSGGVNSVSRIDIASRVVFPLLFVIFNVFYWTLYLGQNVLERIM